MKGGKGRGKKRGGGGGGGDGKWKEMVVTKRFLVTIGVWRPKTF